MKCIQCNIDNNLLDRTANQGKCKYCGHPFVFEPTSMGKFNFTDLFFAKVINDISKDKTFFFTPKQFLYFLNQRLEKKNFSLLEKVPLHLIFTIWASVFVGVFLSFLLSPVAFPVVLIVYNLGCILCLFGLSNSPKSSYKTRKSSAIGLILLGILTIAVGLFVTFIFINPINLFVGIGIGSLVIGIGIVQKRKASKTRRSFLINMAQVNTWLNQWIKINGKVYLMLPEKSSFLESILQSNNKLSELTAYSFDRLVVCDSDEIAQMLMANNFHLEYNCAIVSILGYPYNLFNTMMTMLRRNPKLKVFTFHNCSPAGMKVIHQLCTDPTWFANSELMVVDIGLLPRQIIEIEHNMFVLNDSVSAVDAQYLIPQIRQSLSDQELQWLDAGNYVELESFSPQTLILILQRCIAASEQMHALSSNLLLAENENIADTYSFFAIDNFS